jgi:hypothetical protein
MNAIIGDNADIGHITITIRVETIKDVVGIDSVLITNIMVAISIFISKIVRYCTIALLSQIKP